MRELLRLKPEELLDSPKMEKVKERITTSPDKRKASGGLLREVLERSAKRNPALFPEKF